MLVCLFVCLSWFLIFSGMFEHLLCRTSTNQRIKCRAEGHNTVLTKSLEPETPRSQVKHFTSLWWCFTPGQQYFSHVGAFSCLPGLNQYSVVQCPNTAIQHPRWGSNQRPLDLKSNTGLSDCNECRHSIGIYFDYPLCANVLVFSLVFNELWLT